MQLASAIIHLSGKSQMGIPKENLTPAEVLVLAHIHGEGSITSLCMSGEIDRSSAEELARLQPLYGATGHMDRPDADRVPILSHLFPGARPQLPMTFADAGYDAGELIEAPKAPTKAPVIDEEEVIDEDEGDEEEVTGVAGGAEPVKRGRGRPRKDATLLPPESAE